MTKRTKIVMSLGIAFLLMSPCIAHAQKGRALLKGGEGLLGTSSGLAQTVERAVVQRARSDLRYVIIEQIDGWHLLTEKEAAEWQKPKPLKGNIPLRLQQAVAAGNLGELQALIKSGVKIPTSQGLMDYFEAEMRLLEMALPHPETLSYLLSWKELTYLNNVDVVDGLLIKTLKGNYTESFFVLLPQLPDWKRSILQIELFARLALDYEHPEMAISIMKKFEIRPTALLRFYNADISGHRQRIDFLKQYELEHP